MIESTVLKHGFCNECATYGISRFFQDGSFEIIIKPCYHQYLSASMVSRERILKELKLEAFEPEVKNDGA